MAGIPELPNGDAGPVNQTGATTTDTSQMQKILAALIGGGAGVATNALANNSAQNNVPPELRQLLAISAQRQAYQNPLFQAVNSGAYQMLPNFAKTGNPGMSGNLSNAVPSVDSGSGVNPLIAGAAGYGLGSAVPFSAVIAGLRKLFAPTSSDPSAGNTNNGSGGFMGPQQPANGFQYPANFAGTFDPNMLDPNGSMIKNPGQGYGPAGLGVGQSAREPGGAPDGSAQTVGYF